MTNPSAKSVQYAWRCIAVAAGLTAFGWSSEARAQGWLADRRFAEGPGIRTGDLELHPGIGAEVGYDSNWFLRSSTEGPNVVNGAPTTPPTDAGVIRVTPSFYVSTLGNQRLSDTGQPGSPRFVSFRGGVSATGRFFIGKGFTDQHNVALNADARLGLNEGRPVAVGVFGSFVRVIQPQVFADPNLAFNRDDVRLGADVTFLPGGGTLDLRAGYAFVASLYEESNGVPFSSVTHELSIRDRWKFRPRTALFSEAGLSFVDYPNAPRATFLLNNSTPLRTRLGVTGLVTDWFGATVAGGYSATFFQNPELATTRQFDSFNAQVDGTFYIGGAPKDQDSAGEASLLLSTIQVGAQRDFQRSLVGNFYTSNRVFTALQYWFASRVLINLRVMGEQLNYPQVFVNGFADPTAPGASVPDFTNYRLIGTFFAEYRFTSTFGLNTTVEYARQFSDTQLPAGPIPGSTSTLPPVFDMNYGRLQAFLGARYFY